MVKVVSLVREGAWENRLQLGVPCLLHQCELNGERFLYFFSLPAGIRVGAANNILRTIKGHDRFSNMEGRLAVSKAAVVGPQDLVNEILALGPGFPELDLVPAPYHKETQAAEIVKSHIPQVEMVIFTGPVPYLLARDQVAGQVRMVYVRYTGAALYRTLFEILKERKGDTECLKRVSIDILPAAAVMETFAELGLDGSDVHVIAGVQGESGKTLVEQHQHYYTSGLSTAAVSCLTSAYEELRSLGLPTYRIRPTRFDMREALQLACMESVALYHQKAQVAVGVLRMDIGSRDSIPYNNVQRLVLDIHQLLLDFGQKAGASVTYLGGYEFLIFTTRGALQRSTRGFREAPLLMEISEKLGINAGLGLGLGHSAGEAENNARAALAKSMEEGAGHCYIFMEGGAVIGPLDSASPLRYRTRTADPRLISLAETSGLSVATINRLQAVLENYGRSTLTANEVAVGLGITLRSARRLLNAMTTSELARVVGEEQPVSRGRPRKVYDLKIDEEGGV
ncbi:MAG: hypothetical protein PWP70_1073 [Moorella sp. (in: firmicutes)]|nr:hypothetical protein [Moorella sp. (in: firmicutes)]